MNLQIRFDDVDAMNPGSDVSQNDLLKFHVAETEIGDDRLDERFHMLLHHLQGVDEGVGGRISVKEEEEEAE